MSRVAVCQPVCGQHQSGWSLEHTSHYRQPIITLSNGTARRLRLRQAQDSIE
jgi:hypothetical protein